MSWITIITSSISFIFHYNSTSIFSTYFLFLPRRNLSRSQPRVVVPENAAENHAFNDDNAGATAAAAAATSSNNVEMESPPMHSASSTPEGASPVSTSTENLAAEQRTVNNGEVAGAVERPANEANNGPNLAELILILFFFFLYYFEFHFNSAQIFT